MSEVLARWNALSEEEAVWKILPCSGSRGWAAGMARRRPLGDEAALLVAADEVWRGLAVKDWMEAFASHPRIGERKAPESATGQSAAWSAQEQRNAAAADGAVKAALAAGNVEYERRFGRVFLVGATGKSASEILEVLRRRLRNDDATELKEAGEEQRKITAIRLKKWLLG
jgi:2-oxo-4-hydroxy-4-carboxy-5-ureidoimidazoline decarboxylase